MIRSLNIDPMFIPTALPEIEHQFITFGGGEQHIKLNTLIMYHNIDKVVITHRVKNGDDIMKILIAVDALKRQGVKTFDLIMPYIPYARQDRQCAEGESFTLKVFTDIINSIGFEKVTVFDAHSDVAPALINNCVNASNNVFVATTLLLLERKVILVSPDSGANKKTNKLYDVLNKDLINGIVKCDKKRNTKDGSLSGFEVFADDLERNPCLIVDDICARGGTFKGIAQALKEKRAGLIYLFVTHYEGTANEKELYDAGIEHVFKTNSMNDIENNFITNYKIQI